MEDSAKALQKSVAPGPRQAEGAGGEGLRDFCRKAPPVVAFHPYPIRI